MFWILHNNVRDGTEWWFKGLVLVHDMDMSWLWLGSGSC